MSIFTNLKDWIQYRLKILDRIELKLRRMKRIAIKIRDGKADPSKRKSLEEEFHQLKKEVEELDENSKKQT